MHVTSELVLELQVTYFQVLSSFSMYRVDWPTVMNMASQATAGPFALDAIRMPGIACLWANITFETTVFVYTLGPLVALCFFSLPLAGAFARGLKSQEEERSEHRRWSLTLDKFWTNTSALFDLR